MKGKKLEFISFIRRDGSGTVTVGSDWFLDESCPKLDDMSYLDECKFTLNRLSLSHRTFIASGFNSWVVKLKK
jgi:hypothetical protein